MHTIIEDLRYFTPEFPRASLEAAILHKEEITPLLLEVLEELIEQPEMHVQGRSIHIYATYLLAQFREEKAFSTILELVTLPHDQVFEMFGIILTEELSSILYSTFDGDFELLKNTIEDSQIHIDIRTAALDVYGKLYAAGRVTQEELVVYFRELLWENPAYDENNRFATSIQGVIAERHIFEMIEDVQRLYDEGRIFEFMYGTFDDFIDTIYDYLMNEERVSYINDVTNTMDKWLLFEATEEVRRAKEEKDRHAEALYQEKLRKQEVQLPAGWPVEDELLEVQERWLRDYPILEGKRQAGEVRLTDHFDEEAIAIDRLVYIALHRRREKFGVILIGEELESQINRPRLAYLEEAYKLFHEKCEKENIWLFDDYDKRHKIHYRCEDWIEIYATLLERENGRLKK